MRNALSVLLTAVVVWFTTSGAVAQTSRPTARTPQVSRPAPRDDGRVVQARYEPNPITRWAAVQDGQPAPRVAGPPMFPEFEGDYVPFAAPGGGAPLGDCSDCGPAACDPCDVPCGRAWSLWSAGFAFTFVRPRYSDNLAFTVTDSGAQSATVTEMNFDYDLELSPRLWLQWGRADSIGWRIQWWQLDQDSDPILAVAPASGLGIVEPPAFPDIDISVTLPGETLEAASRVKLYAIDFEGTRHVDFGCWSLTAAGGLRYAKIEQEYLAVSTNAAGDLAGALQQNRELDGIGPTFFLEARRAVTPRLSVFSNTRASLLFGDSETTLTAGEDLDLASSFVTTRTSQNDDLLPILEGQLGVEWRSPITPCHDFLFNAALEGQWWSGVGTASNENADLGLFGFVLGLGMQY